MVFDYTTISSDVRHYYTTITISSDVRHYIEVSRGHILQAKQR